MRKGASKMWAYFTKKENNRAECNYCKFALSIAGGSLGNLRRHLRIKHFFDPSAGPVSSTEIDSGLSSLPDYNSNNGHNISDTGEDVKFMFHAEDSEIVTDPLEVESREKTAFTPQSREMKYRPSSAPGEDSYSKEVAIHGNDIIKDQYTVFREEVGMPRDKKQKMSFTPQQREKKPRHSSPLENDPVFEVDVIHGNGLLKDQYTVFGEEVGMRIRDLSSPYARKIIKHLISTTLFEAEMGKYDNPNSYAIQPSILPHFPQIFPPQPRNSNRKSKNPATSNVKPSQGCTETDSNDSIISN